MNKIQLMLENEVLQNFSSEFQILLLLPEIHFLYITLLLCNDRYTLSLL